METYADHISRLEQTLSEIGRNIRLPVDQIANSYRIATENICKAILCESPTYDPHAKLEKLSADAAKILELTEPARDVGQFKTDVRYIQNTGNTFSHDSAGSNALNSQDQDMLFRVLASILRITFFGNNEIPAPKLPLQMRRYFSTRQLRKDDISDIRISELAKICHPKNDVSESLIKKDRSERLNYEYTSINLGGNLSKGLLFLRQESSIERTLQDVINNPKFKKPSALEIITPKIYRPDGRPINRVKSIQDKLDNVLDNVSDWNVHVKYFDDFAWEYSLPNTFKNANLAPSQRDYFIQQKIQQMCNPDLSQKPFEPIAAIEYIDAILSNPQTHSAVHVVAGQAGIGKTTLCDSIAQHIQSNHRRKSLIISATDFRQLIITRPIASVQDLYAVASENDLIDEAISIENKNFEINLACGNLVLILDGFDELESHIGDLLSSTGFISSLGTLDQILQNVLVIMTVREHNIDRFMKEDHVTVCRLLGFSEADSDNYLANRLNSIQLPDAKRMLRAFDSSSEQHSRKTIPLYASLICDHLHSYTNSPSEDSYESRVSSFFWVREAIDDLISKIICRELTKQSLNSLSLDDYFEILIEVVRSPQATISIHAIDSSLQACNDSSNKIPVNNFLRNPFLSCTGELAKFKYDSLLDFFKSRYVCRRLLDGNFSMSPSTDFLAEASFGTGPLFEELVRIISPSEMLNSVSTEKWIAAFRNVEHNHKNSNLATWRRAMSTLLYWCTDHSNDKLERAEILNRFFVSDVWVDFSIFGKFHNVDFTKSVVMNGYLENFTSISTCDYNDSRPTFNATKVIFDDIRLPGKLEKYIFDSECELSKNLDIAFQAKKQSEETELSIQQENLYRILKVGFRGNAFLWKSETMYRKATVNGKFTLQGYLEFLCERGVIRKEPSKYSSDFGYIVAPAWQEDARKLIEDRNATKRIKMLLTSIPVSGFR